MRRASLVGGGRRQPRSGTTDDSVKLLVIASVLVILAAAAAWFMHGKAKTARDTNAQAVAAKSAADARLEQAGGDPASATTDTGEAAQIIDLADGRMNWRRVLLDLSAATPVGVKLDAFSASAPGASGNTGVTFNGSARDQAQLQQFIRGLRSKPRSFATVDLHSVQQSESAGVTFSVAVTLTPPDTDTQTPPDPSTQPPPDPADPGQSETEPAGDAPARDEQAAEPQRSAKPATREAERRDDTAQRRDTPRQPSRSSEPANRSPAPAKNSPSRRESTPASPRPEKQPGKAATPEKQKPDKPTGTSNADRTTKPSKDTSKPDNAAKGEQPSRGPVNPGGGATAPREEPR